MHTSRPLCATLVIAIVVGRRSGLRPIPSLMLAELGAPVKSGLKTVSQFEF